MRDPHARHVQRGHRGGTGSARRRARRAAECPVQARETYPPPSGEEITPEAAAAAVGTLLPEGAIVVDEALTAASAFISRTRGAATHDYLQVTGGAIGIGLPLATGAAVACGSQVICLQADGSAMYTVQALWTQAREGLDVTTVLLDNRSYAILKHELANVGAGDAGRRALDMMELDRPALDWVDLARGMGIEAGRAKTIEELERQFAAGLRSEGPVSNRPRAVAALSALLGGSPLLYAL